MNCALSFVSCLLISNLISVKSFHEYSDCWGTFMAVHVPPLIYPLVGRLFIYFFKEKWKGKEKE